MKLIALFVKICEIIYRKVMSINILARGKSVHVLFSSMCKQVFAIARKHALANSRFPTFRVVLLIVHFLRSLVFNNIWYWFGRLRAGGCATYVLRQIFSYSVIALVNVFRINKTIQKHQKAKWNETRTNSVTKN